MVEFLGIAPDEVVQTTAELYLKYGTTLAGLVVRRRGARAGLQWHMHTCVCMCMHTHAHTWTHTHARSLPQAKGHTIDYDHWHAHVHAPLDYDAMLHPDLLLREILCRCCPCCKRCWHLQLFMVAMMMAAWPTSLWRCMPPAQHRRAAVHLHKRGHQARAEVPAAPGY